jgi:DNA-directed RNA polymerase II subunit RPB2
MKGKDWKDWIAEGKIEYLDVEETNASLIAMTPNDLQKENAPKYTHMELHPSLIFGVMASLIPFSDHNQAPRNTYQAAQAKQAIGIYTTNYSDRYDSVGHILHYPQQPLIKTFMSTQLHNDKMPNGINAIVAIACYTGFNQEDSVILNRSAVQRGMFVSTSYKTFREQNNRNHATGQEEIFARPDITDPVRALNYEKLDDDGFVPHGTYVQGGDVIIGKCLPIKDPLTGALSYKDNSIALKHTDYGIVDRNAAHNRYFSNINGDGYTFAKVRIRTIREPSVGDKYSSRSGQKGTCGILYDQEDMPFTEDGIVPDIIMNPHAIPSRMTIGQLLESVLGLACTEVGCYGDATPFTGNEDEETRMTKLAELLSKHCGGSFLGNKVLYDGRTGEKMSCSIFIGPTYYQRLKHMSADKIHSRAGAGPIVMLTRQPAEGRARDGGLRIGEMEVECNWAHGDMQFLKERLVDCSDNYRVHVCRECGCMAVSNPEQRFYMCRNCKSSVDIAEIRIPYACKLLFQELSAMSIAVRMSTSGNFVK